MIRLSDRQREVFNLIRSILENTGMPPTFRDLAEAMGYRSVATVQEIVAALRDKGFLEPPEHSPRRSLQLTRKGREDGRSMFASLLDDDAIAIPQLGSVPAGNPLEAIEDRIGVMSFSLAMLPRPRPRADQLFALRADGKSMIGAMIDDGDWLVVKSQSEADIGAIVVARVGDNATVKRLGRDPAGWFLKPENPEFAVIRGSDDGFSIIGKVVAVVRTLET